MPSLARSVSKALKVPSLARSVPKPLSNFALDRKATDASLPSLSNPYQLVEGSNPFLGVEVITIEKMRFKVLNYDISALRSCMNI